MEQDEVDVPPQLVHEQKPEPRWEVRDGDIDPVVTVRMLVGTDGLVRQVEVVQGAGVLRDAAIEAATQFRFEAGRHQGKLREVWLQYPVLFLAPQEESR